MKATSTANGTVATDQLRRAAVRATWAYSVYNTQPWRLRLERAALHLYLDRSRQLNVVDPTSRLMTMSLGCALFNARVSMAADGVACDVERLPTGVEPDLAATLRVGAGSLELASLNGLLETRFCDQRLFFDEFVPGEVIDAVQAAAAAEGARLLPVHSEQDRRAVTALSMHADAIENLNPAYRAEARAWAAGAREQPGALAENADGSAPQSFLALLCTDADTPTDWLRAGEALQRVLLEVARAGFATRVLVQLSEVPSVRSQLRRDLRLSGFAHVLLRVGRAPSAPMPGRRRLVDTLIENI